MGQELIRQAQRIEAQHLRPFGQEVADLRDCALSVERRHQHNLGNRSRRARSPRRRAAEHRLADPRDILDVAANQPQFVQSVELRKAFGEAQGIVKRELAVAVFGREGVALRALPADASPPCKSCFRP